MKSFAPLLLLLPCSLTLAAESGEDIFAILDRDGNGYLSQSEAEPEAPLSAAFDEYDRDGDGQISRAEFDAYLNH